MGGGWGGILKVLTGKMRFFERPSPMSHFAFFFSNIPPLFCIYAAYQILLKEAEKARNCNFNLKLQSRLHVNTQLWNYDSLLDVFLIKLTVIYYQSIMRYRESKIELKKTWAQKTFEFWTSHFFMHPVPHVVLFVTFFESPTPSYRE